MTLRSPTGCRQFLSATILSLAVAPALCQDRPPTTAGVEASIRADHGDHALTLLEQLLRRSPRDLTLLRSRFHLLLGMGRDYESMEAAQDLLQALPAGVEKTTLQTYADRSRSLVENLESAEILRRLETLKRKGEPHRMVLLIDILETRIHEQKAAPSRLVGEFFGSDNKFFNRDKARKHFNLYLAAVVDKGERVTISKILLTLEMGEKLPDVIAAVDRGVSPAVQEIVELLAEAEKAQAAAAATGSRQPPRTALAKTLKQAMALTRALAGADLADKNPLGMLICNSRGSCQEVLAAMAKHRRPQEVQNIRAQIQGHAVLEYEKTLEFEGDTKEGNGISAKAWALHRIADISAQIAQHHVERKASYAKFGKSYPLDATIIKNRRRSHEALERLRVEYPAAKDGDGRSLSEIRTR